MCGTHIVMDGNGRRTCRNAKREGRRLGHDADSTPLPVPMVTPVATWDGPMWIVRVVYTATEVDMISTAITVGFEHPAAAAFTKMRVSGA